MQESVEVRDAMNDARRKTWGASPTLEMRSGPPAAHCAAPARGKLLASIALPADPLAPSAGGVTRLRSAWRGAASADGKLGHYRIVQGAVCHQHGTASGSLGAGELRLKQKGDDIAALQLVEVDQFTLTRGNA